MAIELRSNKVEKDNSGRHRKAENRGKCMHGRESHSCWTRVDKALLAILGQRIHQLLIDSEVVKTISLSQGAAENDTHLTLAS